MSSKSLVRTGVTPLGHNIHYLPTLRQMKWRVHKPAVHTVTLQSFIAEPVRKFNTQEGDIDDLKTFSETFPVILMKKSWTR